MPFTPDPRIDAASTAPVDHPVPEDLTRLAQDLVRIPSVTGNEGEVAAFAEGWLRAAGLDVEIIEEERGRPNIIATTGDPKGPLFAFNGHIDTVPVPDEDAWSHPPFGGEIEEGRLYGRGAIDMKASCAAGMWAAAQFAGREDLPGRVQVLLVVDEEKGGETGSRVVASAMESGRLDRPDGIFSGELSYLHVRTAERGIFQFKIRFRGRAAHTARSRVDGINAIAAASRGILALEHHIDRFHPAVGYPVLSVNRVEGGSAPNQVPPTATVLVDRRLVPGETPEEVEAEVREVLDAIPEEIEDGRRIPVEYDIITSGEGIARVTEPNMTDPDEAFVRTLWDQAEGVLGSRPDAFTDWGGATDARYFRKLGIPMVIFGPTGAGAHAPDEYVDLSSLGAVAEVYRRTFARSLGIGSG
ncbi:MAG: M20 family metallopeptidase [bacterium]